MIAEVVINRTARRLNRTFDYKIPKDLEELIVIGSTVLVPFGKASHLVDGYVIGIKENTTYEVKEIAKIEHKQCIRCFCCQELCPSGAVSVHRTAIARFLTK